jgi:hypothetical protein
MPLKGLCMIRYVSILFLGVMLVCGGMGCAPKLIGPTQPSGHFFSLIVSDPQIYLLVNPPSDRRLRDFAQVVVRVQNAQGQPIDGVPVEFQVEPAWAQHASFTPQSAITQGGEARAVFRAKTTGPVRIVVRVEDMARETIIIVSPSPETGSGR